METAAVQDASPFPGGWEPVEGDLDPSRRPGAWDPPPARATILLVDDEPAVRALIERILRRGGHRVLPAAGWAEADAAWDAAGGAVDVLVTDVTMPEVDGLELARRLRARRPELPVLFVSGHPLAAGDGPARDPNAHLLPKPFTAPALLAALGDLLDGAVR